MTHVRGALAGRRAMMVGGSLVLLFSNPIASLARPEPANRRPSGSLKQTPLLDSWVRIDTAGKITIFTGKVEFGQGIKTALIQIAAEALDVSPGQIELVTADTARTPNEGFTAGSHSMQDSGTAILNAASEGDEARVASRGSSPGSPSPPFVHPKTVALYRELAHEGVPEAREDPVRL